MKGRVQFSELLFNWKTFTFLVGITFSLVGILLTGFFWANKQIKSVEKSITDNRILIIQEISDLRGEINQYHFMIGSLQEQHEKLAVKFDHHQLDRKIHN